METAVTTLYRSVSEAELRQILRTGKFELHGAAEGKYFWEAFENAAQFADRIGDPQVVRALYLTDIAQDFTAMMFDGIGPGRFASEKEMNQGLLEISRYEV
jgi:hypothetical protein